MGTLRSMEEGPELIYIYIIMYNNLVSLDRRKSSWLFVLIMASRQPVVL